MYQLKTGCLFSLFLILYVPVALCADNEGDGEVTRLRQHIFQNYSRNIRPVPKNGSATIVSVQLAPMYLLEIDELRQLLVMDTLLIMHWLDDRLSWNKSEFNGLDWINLGQGEIWQPDIVFFRSISMKIDEKLNTHVHVFNSGNVLWVPPMSLKTPCPINTTGFPNDELTCTIEMNSWTHHGLQIELEPFDEELALYYFENNNLQWNLSWTSVSKIKINYSRPYIYLEFKLNFRRRPVASLQVVQGPSLAILFMSLAMFWFPPKLDKVFIGTIAVLCLVVLVAYVARNTPYPPAVPLAVSSLLSMIYIVTSAMILEIIACNIPTISGLRRPPDRIRILLSSNFFRFFLLGVPKAEVLTFSTQLSTSEVKDAIQRKATPEEEWRLVTATVDRVIFIIYAIVFIAVYFKP